MADPGIAGGGIINGVDGGTEGPERGAGGDLLSDLLSNIYKWPVPNMLHYDTCCWETMNIRRVMNLNDVIEWHSVIHFADKPTEVKLGIYVNSFYSISEQTMVGFWFFENCFYVRICRVLQQQAELKQRD